MPEQQPCWPECKEMLLLQLKSEIERIESILTEREKATQLLAKNEVTKQQAEIMGKYVEQSVYNSQIANLQEQLTGRWGLESRMRLVEMSRGSMDAKLYMMLIGIPIAVSVIVALITQVFMVHIMK